MHRPRRYLHKLDNLVFFFELWVFIRKEPCIAAHGYPKFPEQGFPEDSDALRRFIITERQGQGGYSYGS